ncbi:MAG: ATPase [Candidatus Glassbacteria bacterium RIFCSPLOWO2_12_FULL_58_11]|uniref:ATPase n=1 Tax=Candidatus Glassbacteria bacterium RIFCSPLOWO2_12_FULL_58_11 TaxID=1817867 RepID=A0A1F5YQJ0_9BACT|nr:MAG: ATPase [Candidatus Glassbacteria bacterium RIFCSPLOWO2_12_FULL_58_11]
MNQQIQVLNEQVKQESQFIERIIEEVGRVIVGQRYMVERLLLGILCDGHVLIEGVPGLAKTLCVRTLSRVIDAGFGRVQFTPDLLPADLTGTQVYSQKTGEFIPRKGPIFTNIVLADEVNRAPAKVQSALLEAMQERQVTIGASTYPLPEPFLVLATENPIEQEGTYPLPEAQVDRFMFKLKVTYPRKEEERQILERMSGGDLPSVEKRCTPADILRCRKVVRDVYMDEKIKDYIVTLVLATREPAEYGLKELDGLIEYGASPRATIYLAQAAKANAFLRKRGYVTPEDVKQIGMDILRHRVLLTYEAEAEEMTSEDIVKKVFERVEVP